VDVTGAEIVLSSSWRSCRKSREDIGKVLEHFGLSYRNCTPDYEGRKTRGEEISAWLSIQDDSQQTRYVILDDSPEAEFAGHGNNFINVDFQEGLTEKDVELAYKILMGNKGFTTG
jgi:hypothetical protein